MPKNRTNFTKDSVKKLPLPESGRVYYYDTQVRGLELAVTSNGVKSWRVYRKIYGKPQRISLGRFPDVLPNDARAKALEINAAIARGENPAADMRQDLTFRELFSLYLERHSKPHKRSWQGDQWVFDKYLTRWSSRRLSTILRGDVERLHAAIGAEAGKYSANRALALVSSMFNKARHWGWEGSNPAQGVKKFKEEKRERFLYADELPAFFAALKAEPDIDARDAILVMILSGARKMNVLAMRWQDVNLTRALWTIPLTKSGEPQRVPLVSFAVELLSRRQAIANGSPYVFPGRHGEGHRVEIKSAWNRVRNAANLPDVRLHDLRRTLGSWQAAAGVSLPIIGKSLGHKDVNTTTIYARLDLDPVRAAVTAATDALLLKGGLT